MSLRSRRAPRLAPALLALLLVAACGEAEPTATPSPSTPVATATPAATATAAAPTPTPSPTPEPFALELPEEESAATIEFSVEASIPAEGAGQILVTVTNTSDELIDEIVLRWPTSINETVFLAPFEPGPDRMVNPLAVPWTRWVEGPGTRGEPVGTTSLGWGPIDPGQTLEIEIVATRRAEGGLEFDLQFLEGQRDYDYQENEPEMMAVLLLDDGEPAVTRVTIEP